MARHAEQSKRVATHLTLPCPTPPRRAPHAPQVFISYGAQANGSLLQYYAFTEPGNPNDVYAWEASLAGQPVQVRQRAGAGGWRPGAAAAPQSGLWWWRGGVVGSRLHPTKKLAV